MPNYKCPSCREETISLKEKYLVGWWKTTTCPNCGARLTAFPLLLALFTFLYVWNLIWWTGLVIFDESYIYLIFMAVCWLLIDFMNVSFVPLAAMRKKTQQEPQE